MSEMLCTDTWERVVALLRCLPDLECAFEPAADSIALVCRTITVHASYRSHSDTTPEENRLARWRRQCNALELLTLLWLVDLDGWKYVMEQLHVYVAASPLERTTALPVYSIHFHERDDVAFQENVLQMIQSSPSRTTDDSAFEDATNELLALADERRNVIDNGVTVVADWATRRIPFRIVEADTHLVPSATIARWLQTAQDVLSRFEFTGIDIQQYMLRAVSTDFIERVSRHVAYGIPLHSVSFGVAEGGASVPQLQVGRLMTALTGPHGATSLETGQLNYRRTSEAFLSALTGTNTAVRRLQSLHLICLSRGETTSERRCDVLWLLFAVFSQHAQHRIGSVVATAFDDLVNAELDWFRDTFHTPHAGPPRLELLIPGAFDAYVSEASLQTERWLVVPRGHPIRIEEHDDDSVALRFQDDNRRFRVLRDDPTLPSVDVLVPGYGHCWVERSETLQVVASPRTAAPWRFDQHSVQTVELSLFSANIDEQHAILTFLSLVGAPVRTLRLMRLILPGTVDPDALTSATLASIARSCPQLSCLVLGSVPAVDHDAIVNVYEHEPTLPLLALDLGACPFVDRLDLPRFLETLCDRTFRISRTLRELAIDPSAPPVRDDPSFVEHVESALLRMLRENDSVRRVHVRLTRAQHQRLAPVLYVKRYLSFPKAPLPLRAKCAFLSVVTHALTTDVHRHVFAFAATCETRIVSVTVTD